ncbi:Heat shock protein 90-4 [Dendrobium catenatum]|uniref:Heat shock protein 90-4 n=1 Tax=Dendrobium catenatum TaxID=906689 RepID=A0A2I0VYN4_9ASPA|nr:Heat shock protein 90-4 [Dendrobium catenatum]
MATSNSSDLADHTESSSSGDPLIHATLKFVVSNLKNFVTFPLASDNYALWRSPILKIFRANGFEKFLDPTSQPPPSQVQRSDGTFTQNPSYVHWTLTDQNLSAAICSTISATVLLISGGDPSPKKEFLVPSPDPRRGFVETPTWPVSFGIRAGKLLAFLSVVTSFARIPSPSRPKQRSPLTFKQSAISSTSPSVEFGFEEFEDPLPNSSFLPLYDEPVYDVYDDDMFNEILDLEQPTYDDDDDESKMDSQPKLVVPSIPDRTMSMLSIIDIRLGMIQADHGKHLDTFVHSNTKCMEALALDTDIGMVDQFGVGFDSNLENYQLNELTKKENSNDKDEKERKKNKTLKFIKNFHQLQLMLKFLLDGVNDTEWKYPG